MSEEKKTGKALDESALEGVSGGEYKQPRWVYTCPACGYSMPSAKAVPSPKCGTVMV